jgi:hypothetical protein
MSGWENLPEETPAAPPAASPAPAAMSDVTAEIQAPGTVLVTDGDLIRAAEWYFPALWIGMLAVVAFIGIYSAVGKLPNSPW